MSGRALLFRDDSELLHFNGQTAARAMQSNARGNGRAAKKVGEVCTAKALPADQQQDLPVSFSEAPERERSCQRVIACVKRVVNDRAKLRTNPLGELNTTLFSARVIGDDSPTGRIEPQKAGLVVRDGIESSPRDGKRLGDDVSRVLHRRSASQRVSEDGRARRIVQNSKALLALVRPHSTRSRAD